jgi:site-specific recombinase XerD
MATARPFADMLAEFLTVHLPLTRACSRHTVSSYRDAFLLFLRFMDQQQATPPDQVCFRRLHHAERGGLPWLAAHRQAMLDCHRQPTPGRVEVVLRLRPGPGPEQVAQARQVLGVKSAQAPQPAIGYLPAEAMGLLLEHAAHRRRSRDLALLTTLYDTWARVQEACDLSVRDLHLDRPASVTLTGKGRKSRVVPLTPQAAAAEWR